jgi:hypothetical protein
MEYTKVLLDLSELTRAGPDAVQSGSEKMIA